jgi:hypothetical protein
MNKAIESSEARSRANQEAALHVGRLIGRREAFSLVAGRSAAADVESLRRIRDEKAYRQLRCTWEEFCERHVRVARRSVDRAIRLLEEFGPQYFLIAQMAHIGPEEYRAIAPHISDGGVRIGGNVVALLPENGEQVSAAVADLLGRAGRKKQKPPAASADAILRRCGSLAGDLEKLRDLDAMQKVHLASAVMHIRRAAAGLGVAVL